MTLEGYTFSYPSVARFMVALGESGSIRNIDLATSQRETVADSDVLKFRITGDLVGLPSVTSRQAAPSRTEAFP
ncbi:MAG: PilN domain-containing protein [Bacillati bacterium ANGP1]|uniref:PilN domain-containing protein n=1 Tax=Candidatus Segetimicrobium genomatis TaxID=2569760 RepID=A0A537J4C0_9BACT|nr:MAG: PilN domain-containing protein [Terrabacteria group bacterium ANGP1]